MRTRHVPVLTQGPARVERGWGPCCGPQPSPLWPLGLLSPSCLSEVPWPPHSGSLLCRICVVAAWKVSVQFSSVAQSCPTLCNPMNRSAPGLPVHHQLPEFTQTHIHRISDAIQPSHPLSSPSLPPIPPSISVFSNESTLHVRWPKYWSFCFSIIPSKEPPGLIK